MVKIKDQRCIFFFIHVVDVFRNQYRSENNLSRRDMYKFQTVIFLVLKSQHHVTSFENLDLESKSNAKQPSKVWPETQGFTVLLGGKNRATE